MSADRPHFSAGPFCGSCPLNTRLHWGCLVDGSARIAENDPTRLSQRAVHQSRAEQSTGGVVCDSTESELPVTGSE